MTRRRPTPRPGARLAQGRAGRLDEGARSQPAGAWLVAQTLQHWKDDTDLAGIRDNVAVAKLPEAERTAWQALWARGGCTARQATQTRRQRCSQRGEILYAAVRLTRPVGQGFRLWYWYREDTVQILPVRTEA